MNIIYTMLFMLFSGLIVHIWHTMRMRKRIRSLERMIEDLNHKNYSINMTQDEFSRLEDAIYKMFIAMVEAREVSTEINKRQAENLEDIAHQIKTPLTAMTFSLENSSDINQQVYQNLNHQIVRLTHLTDILLKLSSLDARIHNMKRELILASDMVTYVLDILDGDIKRAGVTISCNTLEHTLYGDFYWLCEALINILTNAIHVSHNKTVYISAQKNPIYTSLTVQDQGGGIDDKIMGKLFNRFYKTPNSNGFGIGLAMAKTIAESNHGELVAENIDNGAKFTLKIYS